MNTIQDLHQFLLDNYLESLIGNPGEFGELNCRLCGERMIVRRNQYGPTSWASAMAKKFRLHDKHECPNITKLWHLRAKNILGEIKETSSDSLTELLKSDLEKIIIENTGFKTQAFDVTK